jgi:hypothetical protein
VASSRRTLLRLTGATAAGALANVLAACGSHKSTASGTTTTTRAPGPDVPILNHLLDLEHMTIAAYTAGLPLLGGTAHMAGQRFLIQEFAHAGELGGLVRMAGGKADKAKSSYALGHPDSTEDVLWLLHKLEQAQVGAYVDAIPRLSTPATRAAVAAILGNDAQHVSILRLALGRNPVPSAFVNGHE